MQIEYLQCHIRRSGAHGRVADVSQAFGESVSVSSVCRVAIHIHTHVSGQMLKSSAIRKDLAGHSQALALGDSSSLANSDTCSILSSLYLVSAFVPWEIRDSAFDCVSDR